MTDERPARPESTEPSAMPPAPEQGPPPPYAPGTGAAPGAFPAPPPYAAARRFERGRPLPIKEMRVGEMLDAAIKLYRLRWKTYLGVAAYIIVPLTFVQSFFSREDIGGLADLFSGNLAEPAPAPSTAAIVAGLVFQLIMLFFVLPFLTGAFAKVTADLYGGGEPDIKETYRFALSKTRSILWVSILVGLATFGGFILLVIPALIFYIRFVFSSVVVVAENLRGTDAMRRSWRLARGFFWKTFGTLFLAGLLTNIVAAVVSIPLRVVAEVIGPAAWPVDALGTSLAQVLTRPFLTIIVVLLYFDLRIRKEGLDLALMVDEMSTAEP